MLYSYNPDFTSQRQRKILKEARRPPVVCRDKGLFSLLFCVMRSFSFENIQFFSHLISIVLYTVYVLALDLKGRHKEVFLSGARSTQAS